MPAPGECTVSSSCVEKKLKFLGESKNGNKSSVPSTSSPRLSRTSGKELDFDEHFWDCLINFLQAGSKVMEKCSITDPDKMSPEQKQVKMKELMKRIEDKEKEIRDLNAEFKELSSSEKRCPPKQKKSCPAKQIPVCPATQGDKCPDNCDDNDNMQAYPNYPAPYPVNQNYSQFGPPAFSTPRYDPNMQSMYNRSQPQPYDDPNECDGMCQSPCADSCQKPCNRRSYTQYKNF